MPTVCTEIWVKYTTCQTRTIFYILSQAQHLAREGAAAHQRGQHLASQVEPHLKRRGQEPAQVKLVGRGTNPHPRREWTVYGQISHQNYRVFL